MSHFADRIAKYAALAQQSVPSQHSALSTQHSVDERPGCAYGAVTRQRVLDLAEAINRVEAKQNALLGGVALAVLVEIVRSWH